MNPYVSIMQQAAMQKMAQDAIIQDMIMRKIAEDAAVAAQAEQAAQAMQAVQQDAQADPSAIADTVSYLSDKLSNMIPDDLVQWWNSLDPQTKEAIKMSAVGGVAGAGLGALGGYAMDYNPLMGAGIGALAGAGLGYGGDVLYNTYFNNDQTQNMMPSTPEMMPQGIPAAPGAPSAPVIPDAPTPEELKTAAINNMIFNEMLKRATAEEMAAIAAQAQQPAGQIEAPIENTAPAFTFPTWEDIMTNPYYRTALGGLAGLGLGTGIGYLAGNSTLGSLLGTGLGAGLGYVAPNIRDYYAQLLNYISGGAQDVSQAAQQAAAQQAAAQQVAQAAALEQAAKEAAINDMIFAEMIKQAAAEEELANAVAQAQQAAAQQAAIQQTSQAPAFTFPTWEDIINNPYYRTILGGLTGMGLGTGIGYLSGNSALGSLLGAGLGAGLGYVAPNMGDYYNQLLASLGSGAQTAAQAAQQAAAKSNKQQKKSQTKRSSSNMFDSIFSNIK